VYGPGQVGADSNARVSMIFKKAKPAGVVTLDVTRLQVVRSSQIEDSYWMRPGPRGRGSCHSACRGAAPISAVRGGAWLVGAPTDSCFEPRTLREHLFADS
jgi:hypothetical protein